MKILLYCMNHEIDTVGSRMSDGLYYDSDIVIGLKEGTCSDTSSASTKGIQHMSKVVVTDIDSIAQILKLCVGNLRNPLITYGAYDSLIELTQQHLRPSSLSIPSESSAQLNSSTSSTSVSATGINGSAISSSAIPGSKTTDYPGYSVWKEAVDVLFKEQMPREHLNTLNHLIT